MDCPVPGVPSGASSPGAIAAGREDASAAGRCPSCSWPADASKCGCEASRSAWCSCASSRAQRCASSRPPGSAACMRRTACSNDTVADFHRSYAASNASSEMAGLEVASIAASSLAGESEGVGVRFMPRPGNARSHQPVKVLPSDDGYGRRCGNFRQLCVSSRCLLGLLSNPVSGTFDQGKSTV